MVVQRSSLQTDLWDLLKTTINVTGVTNVIGSTGYIGDTYPQEFLNDSSKKLPLVIIHRPKITEENLSFTKKKFNVSVQIECVADSSEKAKQLSDAVRTALEDGEATTRADQLWNFMLTAHDERFELRDNKRVHFDILTANYIWLGGGAL